MKTLRLGALAVLTASAIALTMSGASAHDPDTPEGQAAARAFMADFQPAERHAVANTAAGVPCVNGKADIYPCKNVDLLSVLPLAQMGGGNGNDIWGWTDPSSGKEYAIVGRTNGTAFVDVSTPTAPKYLGNLPSNGGSSSWRDMKVYQDHAFIVADAISGHGMQVFDLTRLRTITTPQTFTADALYKEFGPAHNIAINEESGFAYAIGSNTCSGGPHMVDIRTPKSPKKAGCVSQDGYTHDNQCVIYRGPDATYRGREICFNSNEDTLTIVDVTDKANPVQLSRKAYSGAQYSHQGWLTEDQRYFLLDDELDESRGTDKRTKTYIWDLASLANPVHTGTYSSPASAIDHNQYIKGKYSYQANYQAGLRILDVSGVASAQLTEAGFFDIYPAANEAKFNGAWSNYPYFASGIVLVNGIEQGLVVVKPNLGAVEPPPTGGKFENTTDVSIPDAGAAVTSAVTVAGVDGKAPATLKVNVDIKHSYRGDLVIDLVAPDGSTFRLKGSNNDSADNVITTYTVDASAEAASGTWQLKVQDVYRADTGYIDAWSIEFWPASPMAARAAIGEHPVGVIMRRLGFVDWVFALVAVAIVVGGAIVLVRPSSGPTHSLHQQAAVAPASHSDGLSEVEGGYRFQRVVMPESRGDAVPVAFRVLGADGVPVTRFLDNQTKQMHFFVVRDDMHVFRHVHPTLDGDTWHVTVDLPDGGAYRMFAEFIPLDTKDPRHPVVLGVPFSLAGDTSLVPVPAPDANSRTATGYSVTRVDEPAGLPLLSERKLRFAIRTPDGTPVESLEPHLGANGHMTGFHTMLLSATHLHPVEPLGAPLINGELTFRSVFAERGEYRLFLEFSHRGRLHTAAITVTVG